VKNYGTPRQAIRLQYHYDAGKIRFGRRIAKARIETRNRATIVTGNCHNIPVYVNCPLCLFCTMEFSKQIFKFGFEFHEGKKNRDSRMNFGECS
jgi:hypothetical protein